MAKLEYTFKTDTMFKMLFVHHCDLLKQFVAELIGIKHDSIGRFAVTNTEMPAEEELERIKAMGVPAMEQMINAYNQIAASPEFQELERLRQRAREDESNALRVVERRVRAEERMKWQAENERLRAEIAELRAKSNG